MVLNNYLLEMVRQPYCGILSSGYARPEERTMNTIAVENVIIELSDAYQPADILLSWAEWAPDLD